MSDSSDLGKYGNIAYPICMKLYHAAETPTGGMDNVMLLNLTALVMTNIINTVSLSTDSKVPNSREFKHLAKLLSAQALAIQKRGKEEIYIVEE